MELSNYELELILQAVRTEREKVEKEYVQAMQTALEKNKYNRDDHPLYGVGDTLTVLQRFNNLMIKLEDERANRNKSVF